VGWVVIKLDIGSIPEGESHIDLSAGASELGVSLESGRLESPVRAGFDVSRKGNELLLRGTASVTAILECARCLDEYTYILEAPIQLWCVIGAETGEGEQRENIMEIPSGAKVADLADHLRSELLVLVPFKPLCRDDCKGLCSKCGANLNIEACSCKSEKHDSRWDALKDIK
jgi:uncharacterized protein